MEWHLIDTTTTRRIKRSNTKLNKLVFIGFIFVTIGVWLINEGAVNSHGKFTVTIGWLGVIFFGFCMIKVLSIKFKRKEMTVKIFPGGLHDPNYYIQEIPWSMITGLSKIGVHGADFVRIDIEPNQVVNLKLTTYGKFVNVLNKTIGIQNTFNLSNGDLDIDFEELYEILSAYLKAHGVNLNLE